MGLNSSLSSPTSEQVCKKGGGKDKVDSDGSNRVNRMMIYATIALRVYDFKVYPGFQKEFSLSLT